MRIILARWTTRLLLVLSVFSVALSSAANVSAATVSTNNATQSGNNGLQISPTRTDLALNPGESTVFQVSIKNVSSISLVAKATLNDFDSDNTTGTPKLIIDPSKHSAHSIKPYLSGVKDIPLKSGELQNAQFTIGVPKDAPPGGYYGAIRYSAVPVNPTENVGPSQVSLTASVASLVLMEVNGPVNEQLSLNYIDAQRNNSPGSIFFGKGPNQVAIKLTNQGNGFSQPIGHVTVSKGGNQVDSYEFNSNSIGLHSTILPQSSRVFTNNIKNTNAFGQYKIVASIAYNQGDQAVTLTQHFWVIPKGYVIGFIIFLIIVVAAIVWWRRGRQSKKHKKQN